MIELVCMVYKDVWLTGWDSDNVTRWFVAFFLVNGTGANLAFGNFRVTVKKLALVQIATRNIHNVFFKFSIG